MYPICSLTDLYMTCYSQIRSLNFNPFTLSCPKHPYIALSPISLLILHPVCYPMLLINRAYSGCSLHPQSHLLIPFLYNVSTPHLISSLQLCRLKHAMLLINCADSWLVLGLHLARSVVADNRDKVDAKRGLQLAKAVHADLDQSIKSSIFSRSDE